MAEIFKRHLRSPKRIFWFFVGGLPFLIFLLFYNYKVGGNALVAPMMLNPNPNFELSLKGIRYTLMDLKNFMMWTPSFLLFIYFCYLPDYFKEPRKNVIALIFPALVIGYLFYTAYGGEGSGHAGNEYGPRYYYEGFPFLALFTVSRLFKGDRFSQKDGVEKFLLFLFIFGFITSIPLSIRHFIVERRVIWERMEPYRLVEKENIKNAVVFLVTGSGTIRPMPANDLIRNNIDYSDSVLYAFDRGKENEKLMEYYSDRPYYLYYYDRTLSPRIFGTDNTCG